jgi:urease subunit gamma
MLLTPRELEKLTILNMAEVALKRKARGLKLNFPEAVAVISAAALESARDGKTLEQVMASSMKVLGKKDVMDGVADLIPFVQVEAVFTDGSRLITVHTPIQ